MRTDPVELNDDFVRSHLPTRDGTAHKGDFGAVGIIAGSYGMAGAAALAIGAAYRCGAGLVYGFLPKKIYPIVATLCPNAVFSPVPASPVRAVLKNGQLNALVIGCGLGRSKRAEHTVRNLIRTGLPFCLDADGINALHGDLPVLRGRKAVITPHVGEAARALGCKAGDIQADRVAAVRELAERGGCTAVLKGKGTLIADGQTLYICNLGNNGMATAGSGDVLAGMIGTFLAQGCEPADAAALSVYLHAFAGDLAAERLCRRSLCAPDLLVALPGVFARFEKS